MKTPRQPLSRLSALLLPVLLAWAPGAAAEIRYEQGKAWDADRQRLLYTESHWTSFRDGQPQARTVLYRCADGTPFARKEINYAPSTLAPAFAFRDARHGYQEGLRWQAGNPQAWFIKDGTRRERPLAASADLVADAGFDEFIRARWPYLAGDGRQNLRFVLPSRLDSYAFKLKGDGPQRYRNAPAQAFTLRLDGLLGLVAPDIEVLYASDSRRLLRFKGISNIRDDAGKQQLDTLIEFPLADRRASPAEKSQARALVLESCQVS